MYIISLDSKLSGAAMVYNSWWIGTVVDKIVIPRELNLDIS